MAVSRKRARKSISLREKLAAALSMLLPQEDRDALRAAKASAAKVIGLFQFDHVVLHAIGGSDDWPNLTPMLIAPHREKSRRDTSIVAKVKRVSREHEDFRARMLRPDKGKSVTRDKRPFPQGRKLQSRNDFQRRET